MSYNFNRILIGSDKTILDALNQLNNLKEINRLILLVVNEKGVLIGTVTDGDIRRSIVKNKDLNKKVDQICNYKFIFKYDTDTYLNLNELRKQDIKILPLLNKDKTLSRVIDLDVFRSIIPLECVIMAGGRGKRLSPLTDNVPKPMLILGDKPIIEHNIDNLISFGIKKIYISVNYLGEQISDYFGDGSSKGIEIEYISEENFLGTAGSLGLVEEFKSDNILLMNADLYTNVNLENLFLKLINENADMAISSTLYKIDVPYAVFESENFKVNALKEKPSYSYYSNAGVYIFKNEILKNIKKNEYLDITKLIDDLISENKKIIHVPILGFWIDIGNPNEYKNAQQNIKHLNNG
jgi:dTDP-glucose pyrophosphorylase